MAFRKERLEVALLSRADPVEPGKKAEAGKLLEECAETPISRPSTSPGEIPGGKREWFTGLKDIARAVTLDTSDWMSWHTLIAAYEKKQPSRRGAAER